MAAAGMRLLYEMTFNRINKCLVPFRTPLEQFDFHFSQRFGFESSFCVSLWRNLRMNRRQACRDVPPGNAPVGCAAQNQEFLLQVLHFCLSDSAQHFNPGSRCCIRAKRIQGVVLRILLHVQKQTNEISSFNIRLSIHYLYCSSSKGHGKARARDGVHRGQFSSLSQG